MLNITNIACDTLSANSSSVSKITPGQSSGCGKTGHPADVEDVLECADYAVAVCQFGVVLQLVCENLKEYSVTNHLIRP
jgi:hypothetical protein